MKYIFYTILFFLACTAPARAATLTLENRASVAVGEQFAVDVLADTGGVSINSVEAAISYPADRIAFVGYQDEEGVVRFWIQPPTANSGTISFAGGIPGGAERTYGGDESSLRIVRLLFKPVQAGTASFGVVRSTILQNDGKGTALRHDASGSNVSVVASNGAEQISDTTPPEPFTATLIQKDRATDTPMLLSFRAVDREGGIATYRVRLGWGWWRDAQSPYPIGKRLFSYYAHVQAVDLAGNKQTTRAFVPGIVPIPFPIALVVLLAAGFGLYFMVKKKV
jgi:hypothetical protein